MVPGAEILVRLGDEQQSTQMLVGAEDVVAFKKPIIQWQIAGYTGGKTIGSGAVEERKQVLDSGRGGRDNARVRIQARQLRAQPVDLLAAAPRAA